MGWSCSRDAGIVLHRWTAACAEQSGMSNVAVVDGVRHVIELSNREHADGAITGTLMREVLRGPQQAHVAPPAHELALGIAQQEGFMAKPAGTFRINGDGSIARAPAWLRKLGA